MRFEVRAGVRRISCAVLDEALEAMSGLTAPSTVALRRGSFGRFRTLIDAAAKLKLEALPPGFVGPVVLNSEDLRCVPPQAGAPSFGISARSPTQSASLNGSVSASAASPYNETVPLGPNAYDSGESR